MVTNDIEISKKIFELLNTGIEQEFESFEFIAHMHEGYMETKLWTTSGGVRSSNAKTDINYAILCSLVEELQECGQKRGDNWKSFSMGYDYGGKVKVNFGY